MIMNDNVITGIVIIDYVMTRVQLVNDPQLKEKLNEDILSTGVCVQ